MAKKPFKPRDIVLMDDLHTSNPLMLKPMTFAELGVREQRHLEEWIKSNPDILGLDLLLVTSQFDRFDKSDKRLDLLAIDREGKLVVIELKRDAARSLVDLQALRYAAFCSSMTFEDVINLHAEFAGVEKDIARQNVQDFVNNPNFSTIDNKPRIILAAGGFDDQEVTSCVLWLRSFGVDISCVEITPYSLGKDRLILVPRTIIPLPEAQDYIIGIEKKEAEEGRLTAAQLRYKEMNRQILNKFHHLLPGIGPQTPYAQNYTQISTGRAGVHFEWRFFGQPNDKKLRVAIDFETKSKELNLKLCALIKNNKAVLEKSLGETLQVEPDWTPRWSSVHIERSCEPWSDDVATWASDKMCKLIHTARPILDDFWSKEARK
jgi:hypothetical protein